MATAMLISFNIVLLRSTNLDLPRPCVMSPKVTKVIKCKFDQNFQSQMLRNIFINKRNGGYF